MPGALEEEPASPATGGARRAQHPIGHVAWIEDGLALPFTVRERRWEGPRAHPAGLERHLESTRTLLAAREMTRPQPSDGAGVPLLGGKVTIGGRRHSTSSEALVRGGELVVLSGPSGSGKTTLLREMAGRAASISLGFVMQDPPRAVPAEMPLGEALGRRLDADSRARFSHWYGARLHDLARPVGTLSDGELQRLLIAGEVVRLEQSPPSRLRLLLLDEPFGALDPAAHLRLMEALLGWVRASSRNAAVLVSHSPLVDLGLAGASGVPAREWSIGGEA